MGLNLGADDYVSKPFRRQELVARVNALLRRHKGAGQNVHRFGPYTLDLASHKLFRDVSEPQLRDSEPRRRNVSEPRPSGSGPPKEVELTPSEFKLLEHFVRNRGRALTRRDILNAVWGNDVFVKPRSINRCVTTLRAKIEADPHNPVFVRTVRDVGYRFES